VTALSFGPLKLLVAATASNVIPMTIGEVIVETTAEMIAEMTGEMTGGEAMIAIAALEIEAVVLVIVVIEVIVVTVVIVNLHATRAGRRTLPEQSVAFKPEMRFL